jgi:uncharacterized protein YkwD
MPLMILKYASPLYPPYAQRFFLAMLIVMLAGCSASANNRQLTSGTQSAHVVQVVAPSEGGSRCASGNLQSEVLSRINRIRAAGAVCGGVTYPSAAALRWSDKLQQAAAVHSHDMAQHNFFNHKSATNGTTLPERLRNVGYKYQSAGENIGAGQASVEQIIATWVASPGHCVTLMQANFVDLGVSCKMNTNSYYKTYWTLKAAVPS